MQNITLTDGTAIRPTNIIGTNHWVVSAWTPRATDENGRCITNRDFSTITTIDGRPYGRIGTECLPAELDALPALSAERSAAVKAWRENIYRAAYLLIGVNLNIPAAARNIREDMGEIEFDL